MSSQRFSINETSEKTVETNILADISLWIRFFLHRQVTIISPTQWQERNLGFDEIIEGLPSGITMALQFKRPYPYSSTRFSNFARFSIDTNQLQWLLGHFQPGEAYYVFVPFPTTREIINNRNNLLRSGVVVDVHHIPNARKTVQRTRTVRVSKSSLSPSVMVADPRVFEETKAKSIIDWCDTLRNRNFDRGEIIGLQKNDDKSKAVKNLYYLHISKNISDFEGLPNP